MTPEEKKLLVEGKLAEFELFFTNLGNEPLARPERAILSSFITWHFGLAKEQEQDAQADGVPPPM